MARKKYLDEADDHQENRGVKGQLQNKKNLLGSSPPRSGSVLGLIHRGRTNQKIHLPNNGVPLSAEDSYFCVMKQLSNDGLTIREMPGDGNCLFRALSDQLEGNTRNHLHHRRAVVQYMKENRSDFEPFVEDDQPFEKYVHSLSQPGTFAGNDAIVAFARLHNVTVVIHQLNSPAWLIHPTSDGNHLSSGREVHIAYHNGDHYNSVRKIGDNSDTPSNIRFVTQEHPGNSKTSKADTMTKLTASDSLQHSGYTKTSTVTSEKNCRSSNTTTYTPEVFFTGRDEDFWVKDDHDIDRLVEEVLQQTDYPDPNFVRETLIEFNFDMVSTVDFILSMSILLSQDVSTQPSSVGVVEGSLVSQKVDSISHENDGKVLLNLDTGIESSKKNSENPAEDKLLSILPPPHIETLEPNGVELHIETTTSDSNVVTSSTSTCSSESIDDVGSNEDDVENSSLNENGTSIAGRGDTKAKLSSRQKKDMKKKERKRDAERRKKCSDDIDIQPQPIAQYSTTSSLRSLNI